MAVVRLREYCVLALVALLRQTFVRRALSPLRQLFVRGAHSPQVREAGAHSPTPSNAREAPPSFWAQEPRTQEELYTREPSSDPREELPYSPRTPWPQGLEEAPLPRPLDPVPAPSHEVWPCIRHRAEASWIYHEHPRPPPRPSEPQGKAAAPSRVVERFVGHSTAQVAWGPPP